MFGETWTRGTAASARPSGSRRRGPRRSYVRNNWARGHRKPDNAPRGRMSAYAFFIQSCREEQKEAHPGVNIVFKEFSKQCADKWKTLKEGERQHFTDMATQDRARYAMEMQSYEGPRIRNRRRKSRKDPRAPKRALSAFFWFCSDERPKIRARTPNATVGQVARELGGMWSVAVEDVKTKYEHMAVADKKRYDVEMEEYKKGNFCRMVEGVEDLPPPDPKNLGKIPNTKRYTYHPPRLQRPSYIGHTVGMGQGSGGRGRGRGAKPPPGHDASEPDYDALDQEYEGHTEEDSNDGYEQKYDATNEDDDEEDEEQEDGDPSTQFPCHFLYGDGEQNPVPQQQSPHMPHAPQQQQPEDVVLNTPQAATVQSPAPADNAAAAGFAPHDGSNTHNTAEKSQQHRPSSSHIDNGAAPLSGEMQQNYARGKAANQGAAEVHYQIQEDEDEMVSDEEMEDNDSVIEDNI